MLLEELKRNTPEFGGFVRADLCSVFAFKLLFLLLLLTQRLFAAFFILCCLSVLHETKCAFLLYRRSHQVCLCVCVFRLEVRGRVREVRSVSQ